MQHLCGFTALGTGRRTVLVGEGMGTAAACQASRSHVIFLKTDAQPYFRPQGY
jgi:hypothetical protein